MFTFLPFKDIRDPSQNILVSLGGVSKILTVTGKGVQKNKGPVRMYAHNSESLNAHSRQNLQVKGRIIKTRPEVLTMTQLTSIFTLFDNSLYYFYLVFWTLFFSDFLFLFPTFFYFLLFLIFNFFKCWTFFLVSYLFNFLIFMIS